MDTRDYYLDNVKVILIFLVIFGHLVDKFADKNTIYNILYIVIYSFHMPLFIFVSGYFSKNVDKSRENAFVGCLVPYLIFNTIYLLVSTKNIMVPIFLPLYIYWYMLSLFIWKLILKDFIKIKHCVLVSILLGIYCGMFDDISWMMSMSRTIVFFPYFLMGYYANKDTLNKIKNIPKYISITVFILMSILIIYIFNNDLVSTHILLCAESYNTIGLRIREGIVYRLLQYGVSIIIGICVLNFISIKKHKYTDYGRKTVSIYLGHAYIIDIVYTLLINKNINTYVGIFLFIMISGFTIFMLGNEKVFYLYQNIIDTFKKVYQKRRF